MSSNQNKILVLDDDQGFLEAVGRLLRAQGYEVDSVMTVPEVQEALKHNVYSCILADIVLKIGSGLEVPKVITAQRLSVPVIFMSASDDIEVIANANSASIVPCLRKPFEADDLFNAIEKTLKSSKGLSGINSLCEGGN